MLENPPMWLNTTICQDGGPKFLHSAVTDSLQVIANVMSVVAAKGGPTNY